MEGVSRMDDFISPVIEEGVWETLTVIWDDDC